MPGHEVSQVKCEPTSDDDECSQYSGSYSRYQLSSLEQTQIKLEQLKHNGLETSHLLQHLQSERDSLEELVPAPSGPAATLVRELPLLTSESSLATLEPAVDGNVLGSALIKRHVKLMKGEEVADSAKFVTLMAMKDEPVSEGEHHHQSGDDLSDSSSPLLESVNRGSPKSWTQCDMENALEALRNRQMSLTKASATFGIPSTTLWQRAHRLGINTPKKDSVSKTWSEEDLKGALHALRAGAISANKASKAYGIPSSTLYKIARREGIRLAAPFNAAPTAWRRTDLARALRAVRAGAAVQRAAAAHGIPTGTLYGRCKREGIELSRSNPTPWSEDAMTEALQAVRVGQMSINQAAIHYNLPYSSLYGRFKRWKYQPLQFQQHQPIPQEVCYPEPESQHQEHLAQPPSELDSSFLRTINAIDSYGQTFYAECNVES